MMLAASDLPWQELHGNLRAFIARRVRNQADVDDLVQRVLLQIVNGLGTLRDAGRLHAWVYRMARNVIVDYYRSAGGMRELAAGGGADLEAVDAAAPREPFDDDDDDTALRELASCLAPMLSQLPPVYQEAVRIVDLQGVTQHEAARRAGVSLSGMKSRVQRGRRQLRAILEECCRVDLDRRGGISAYAARHPGGCGCDGCGGAER
jgi:RNA polymerase sigma-70 factor, ECF subfamily